MNGLFTQIAACNAAAAERSSASKELARAEATASAATDKVLAEFIAALHAIADEGQRLLVCRGLADAVCSSCGGLTARGADYIRPWPSSGRCHCEALRTGR